MRYPVESALLLKAQQAGDDFPAAGQRLAMNAYQGATEDIKNFA